MMWEPCSRATSMSACTGSSQAITTSVRTPVWRACAAAASSSGSTSSSTRDS